MECRCIRHGLAVKRFVDPNPPPTWLVYDDVAIADQQQSFTMTQPAAMSSFPTIVFHRMGVEVDGSGTWMRYETDL